MNRLNSYINGIFTWLFVMILLGCYGPKLPPVTDFATRYEDKNGFSALPPQGRDWYLGSNLPLGNKYWYIGNYHWYIGNNYCCQLLFGKLPPDKLKKEHTFVAAIMVMPLEARKVHSAAEFPKAVEELFAKKMNEDRFKLISIKTAPFGAKGSYCSLFDMAQEERDNPEAPGIVLEITAHGFVCLDTSSKFMINASYIETKPEGSKSIMDKALKQESEGFLANVVVTPFNEQFSQP